MVVSSNTDRIVVRLTLSVQNDIAQAGDRMDGGDGSAGASAAQEPKDKAGEQKQGRASKDRANKQPTSNNNRQHDNEP